MTHGHANEHHHKRAYDIARVDKYFETDRQLEEDMKAEIGNSDFAHVEPISTENNGNGTHTITFCLRHGDATSKPQTRVISADMEPAGYADVQELQTAGAEQGTGLVSGGVRPIEKAKGSERSSAESETGSEA
ncbi:MAG: hypothetical protein Q9162_005375 [Coniocarpon cinnabarinum]